MDKVMYAKGGLLKGDVEDYVPDKYELIIPLTMANRVFKEISKRMYPQFTRWEEEVTKRNVMEKVEAERKKTMKKTRFIIGEDRGEFIPKAYFWKLETKYEPKVGDFAIVENRDSFAMVEILGIGETATEYESSLTRHGGGIHKSVKYILPRQLLEDK